MFILVVEDDAETYRLLGMVLDSLGHRHRRACDLASALSLAHREHFDALLTDVVLPQGTGLDLVKELGEDGCLPERVVSMSASVNVGNAESQAAGCHVHLRKPFVMGQLQAALCG